MTYVYKCESDDCLEKGELVYKKLPMNDRDTQQFCKECCEIMVRVFTAPATQTADGFKK